MNDLILTKEQFIANRVIQLRICIQIAIETLDELNAKDIRFGDKKLNQMLKAIYPSLDKETKKYNELFEVSEESVGHFYNVTQQNLFYIMSNELLDRSKICSYLLAYEKNKKAIEGIIEKILKQ